MYLNAFFSVTLQWRASADSPPMIQCSSCVTCRRSSDPTSFSSPTSSAMRPDCSRFEILSITPISHCLSVVRVIRIDYCSPYSHRRVVFWASPPFWQSSTPKAWVPRYLSWEQKAWPLMLKHASPWWSTWWRRSCRTWGTPSRRYCVE